MSIKTKRLLFYWIASFVLATSFYYLLLELRPTRYVFGVLYRMFLYHTENPISFIAIPCFFYGIIATALSDKFLRQHIVGQILLTILIIVLTIIVSSPFGGMLWHFYDMRAGFFPTNWFSKLVVGGFKWGLEIGWMIIWLSKPYNIFGSIICYFLTLLGSSIYRRR